jgi:hypothetical protein
MSRIQLRAYIDPGSVEIFVNLKLKNGNFHRLTAVVDTGAQVSLFPSDLLEEVEHQITEQKSIVIDQAGIAHQSFEAKEVLITLFFEDSNGNRTKELKVRAWFADTEINLVGFADVLDRATLFIDNRESRSSWIEFDD